MARCIDCRYYPWKPEADPSVLPEIACFGDTVRKWTIDAIRRDNSCPYYEARRTVSPQNFPQFIDGADFKIHELRAKAKELDIPGVFGMKKAELVDAINDMLKG